MSKLDINQGKEEGESQGILVCVCVCFIKHRFCARPVWIECQASVTNTHMDTHMYSCMLAHTCMHVHKHKHTCPVAINLEQVYSRSPWMGHYIVRFNMVEKKQ